MNKKCPNKIYLQVCDECYEEVMRNAPDEITWCVDQMDHANELCNGDRHVNVYDEESDTYSDYPLDIAYVRQDIYDDLLRHLKEVVNDIETIAKYNSGTGIHAFETITEEVGKRVKGLIYSRIPEAKEE